MNEEREKNITNNILTNAQIDRDFLAEFFTPQPFKNPLYSNMVRPLPCETATHGFGLQPPPLSEAEKRKRDEEERAYSISAKRARTEQDSELYEYELSQIKLEAERQVSSEDIFKINCEKTAEPEEPDPETVPKKEEEEWPQDPDFVGLSNVKREFNECDDMFVYNRPEYNLYNYNYDNLPILEYKTQIVDTVDAHNIVIIQGNTGCGKSTQVPQYILGEHARQGISCNIVVTQPRRIAAISVSQRVCDERGWHLGSVCGYKVFFCFGYYCI